MANSLSTNMRTNQTLNAILHQYQYIEPTTYGPRTSWYTKIHRPAPRPTAAGFHIHEDEDISLDETLTMLARKSNAALKLSEHFLAFRTWNIDRSRRLAAHVLRTGEL
ncbi:MAG: hypothetical protein LQ350_007530 [Teloschistes chrysophthalmus]|nr:MAG: hypothetical protein LQ350_007530 [Niorma chrysophthalma]